MQLLKKLLCKYRDALLGSEHTCTLNGIARLVHVRVAVAVIDILKPTKLHIYVDGHYLSAVSVNSNGVLYRVV